MNGYVCFYKGKRVEVYADTSFQAQEKAAAMLKIKKSYEITVVLAEKSGQQVIHEGAML
jgi:hypothetical protein